MEKNRQWIEKLLKQGDEQSELEAKLAGDLQELETSYNMLLDVVVKIETNYALLKSGLPAKYDTPHLMISMQEAQKRANEVISKHKDVYAVDIILQSIKRDARHLADANNNEKIGMLVNRAELLLTWIRNAEDLFFDFMQSSGKSEKLKNEIEKVMQNFKSETGKPAPAFQNAAARESEHRHAFCVLLACKMLYVHANGGSEIASLRSICDKIEKCIIPVSDPLSDLHELKTLISAQIYSQTQESALRKPISTSQARLSRALSLTETAAFESRVTLTPSVVGRLKELESAIFKYTETLELHYHMTQSMCHRSERLEHLYFVTDTLRQSSKKLEAFRDYLHAKRKELHSLKDEVFKLYEEYLGRVAIYDLERKREETVNECCSGPERLLLSLIDVLFAGGSINKNASHEVQDLITGFGIKLNKVFASVNSFESFLSDIKKELESKNKECDEDLKLFGKKRFQKMHQEWVKNFEKELKARAQRARALMDSCTILAKVLEEGTSENFADKIAKLLKEMQNEQKSVSTKEHWLIAFAHSILLQNAPGYQRLARLKAQIEEAYLLTLADSIKRSDQSNK